MRFLFLLLPLFLLAPDTASAAPLAGVVAAVGGAFTAISSTAIGSFLLRTAASFALNALANALIGKPKQKTAGLRTTATTAGGTIAQTLIFGKYATGGNAVCPPMTHGTNGKTVDYLTYVIDLADFPIHALDAVYVNNDKCTFTTPGNKYGDTATSNSYTNKVWARFHDGTQTEADSMLLSVYGGYERPWLDTHILTGVAYAVMTFKFDEKKTQGMPECLFEVRGARLYDPRKDSSVGGVGSQRWNDTSTWSFTENPIVMVYNLLRGLTLADGSLYGVGVTAEQLPIDRWAAAMNVCDEQVFVPGGVTEARYKAGIEFSVEDEPLDVIQQILTSCGGQIAECGGSWNVIAGPATMPRLHFTDDDIIRNRDEDMKPYRGLAETFNGIHASYPSPLVYWKAKDAPPYYNAAWEAEDENRRLTATLNLNTVTSGYQAQRLMRELVGDNRRWTTHTLTLPPGALGLLPLDTLTWTSASNGYVSKLFEVVSKTLDPSTLCVSLTLRERSPGDYEYDYEEILEPLIIPPGNGPSTEPATEETEQDGPYDDPVEIVQPDPIAAELVAVHSSYMSYTTNGGADWVKIDAPFFGGKDISAVNGQGFLVRTDGGKAWFAATPEAGSWTEIVFKDQAAVDALTNGGFEGGLSAWTTVSGSPASISTTNPLPVEGTSYLYGVGAYRIEQSVSLPGDKQARYTGSYQIEQGGSAKIGIVKYGADGTNAFLSFGSEGTSFVEGTSLTTSFGGGFDIRVTLLDNGGEAVQTGSAAYGNYGFQVGATAARFRVELLKGGEVQPDVRFRLGFWDLDGYPQNERLDVFGAEGYAFPSGSQVTASNISGGFRLTAVAYYQTLNDPEGAAYVDAKGSFEFIFRSDGNNRGFVMRPRPASDNPEVGVRMLSETSGWETFTLGVNMWGSTDLDVYIEGVSGKSWFDNVQMLYGEPGSQDVAAVGSDLSTLSRRHVVATDTDAWEVVDGEAEHLGLLPFAATLIEAEGNTLVAAGQANAAISSDNGASWATHTLASPAVSLHARPEPTVLLEDGTVHTIASGGLTLIDTLAAEHTARRDALNNQWFVVQGNSGETQTGAFGGLDDSYPDLPTSTSSVPYRVEPTDAGRKIGWRVGGGQLFSIDDGDTEWTFSPSFTSPVYSLKEVK